MDILKRSLAPITDAAWTQIEKEAQSVLKNNLSARKFVDIDGPHGFNFAAVGLGRLYIPENNTLDGVSYGIHRVQPLVEMRIPFELNIWEMDNAVRGAMDIDLTPVTNAAKKAAAFEDRVIYHGFEPGNIIGLSQASDYSFFELGLDPSGLLEGVAQAVMKLRDEGIEGPYTMVVGPKVWQALETNLNGYNLHKSIEKLVGGQVIYSPVVEDGYLIPSDADDLQLIIGQDFAIGYESNDSKTVKLYLTESFTFRVLNSRIIVRFKLK